MKFYARDTKHLGGAYVKKFPYSRWIILKFVGMFLNADTSDTASVFMTKHGMSTCRSNLIKVIGGSSASKL